MHETGDGDEERYLPSKLFENDDTITRTVSVRSESDISQFMAFSAPMLLDMGQRFYEDFLEEIALDDPELSQHCFMQQFSRKSEFAPHRKFSLQVQQFHEYAHSPKYYRVQTPEDQLMGELDRVCHWAKDQYGSRTVQYTFQNGESFTRDVIFTTLIRDSLELIKDKFGNYVFQKLFQKGTASQQATLYEIAKKHLLSFAQNCYACRVVQKAIEYTLGKPHLQRELVALLEPCCLYLVENLNGNHVMQKCFEVIELRELEPIIAKIISNLQKFSLHAFGCRVIQKYLQRLHHLRVLAEDNSPEELKEVERREEEIFSPLLQMSLELSQCQYGNYVMQHIVLHSKGYKDRIEETFLLHLTELSCNKYASNVVEKAIKLASAEYREKLASLLVDSPDLVTLAKHQYGNYVVQSLLHKISSAKLLLLKSRLKENASQISKSQYGRHVLMQLEKFK